MFRTQPLFAMLISFFVAAPLVADEPAPIKSIHIQKHSDTTYFEVRFAELPGIFEPTYETTRGWWTTAGRGMARTPRLVPQDGKAHSVYFHPERKTFLGKLTGNGPARFELLYAKRAKEDEAKARKDLPPLLADLITSTTWVNQSVEIDFEKVTKQSKLNAPPLVHSWATAQANHFAVLEAQSPEFSYFGFARMATNRKYRVDGGHFLDKTAFDIDKVHRDAYDVTTGAAAITESLQLQRMRDGFKKVGERRTIDVNLIEGVTIAEHPWEKMMMGKAPTPEPLAKLVPHDNYYLHFKNLAKFIELGELAEQWGGNLTSLYDLNSRDYQVKQRYEKQLCIKSTWLGKTLGPLVIRGLAITGSDPYLREGSDVAVLFNVVNRQLFLGAVQQFIDENRKEFGKDLIESKYEYQGVAVEKFATPLREVSLHRATIGDVVIYANSPVGMKRIIDTSNSKHKPLADSLDFQYMRTVMRLEDKLEDGFLFLSDPFIRQLVGPVSKIKERRRIEALTSLAMITNGALFHAWETGKLPADHAALLAGSGLTAAEVIAPEGKKEPYWDPERKVAVSDAYNTIHFATPLVELPIYKVTPSEERSYTMFRNQYMGLWRQYFDPVGIRLKLTDSQIRLETYILPLVATSQYSFLRQFSGGEPATFNLSSFGKDALLQWFARWTPQFVFPQSAGDQITIRLDDDAIFDTWVEYYLKRQLSPPPNPWSTFQNEGRILLQTPVTLGMKIGNEKQFDDELKMLLSLMDGFVGKNERRKFDYKGVTIEHIKFKKDSNVAQELNRNLPEGETEFLPSLYHAKIDGFFYVGFREEPLKRLIDHASTRGDRQPKETELVKGNSAIQLAPSNASKAQKALKVYQEWESHCRAVANCSAWQTLYHTKVLPENASKQEMRDAARRWFGYIPVSPDQRPYVYLAKFDEVENIWHGSPRFPQMRGGFDEHAPLAQLLEQFRTIRAELRFQEDGVNTVVTVERGPAGGSSGGRK